jgi:glycosyltransferase involved in cell wall biosynthesis
VKSAPRVALVHDWLTGMRGGEKVLEALCDLYRDADLFTLVHVPGSVSPLIERRRLRTSFIQRLPLAGRHYRHYLPLFPFAVEWFDLDAFDLVISTSHCAAKAVVKPGRARHLCYCHTPMRYAWDQFDTYFGPNRTGRLGSRALRPVLAALARWDAATAHRVDRFVANSRHVADRIRRYYNRSASVVYPPVDTTFFHPDGAVPEHYGLVVSALVPYKRLDVAIEACRLARVPLKIVGNGPDRRRLAALAGSEAEFLGRCSASDLRTLYRRAGFVLMTGEEDFGIVPLEAQACGRPVVALGRGGATESVQHGVTGLLVDSASPETFAAAIAQAGRTPFDSAVIRAHAVRFSHDRFAREIRTVIDDTMASPTEHARW